MKPEQKSVALLFGHVGRTREYKRVKIAAHVLGHLCAHEAAKLRAGKLETTGRWMVSHVRTGQGSCGDLRFRSLARAIYFMRLLKPHATEWRGDNPYQISSRAAKLYFEAVKLMRANAPVANESGWVPKEGTRVLVVYRDKEGSDAAHVDIVERVDENALRVGGVKYVRGQSGGWITTPRTSKGKPATVIPNVTANRKRFLKEDDYGESTRKKTPRRRRESPAGRKASTSTRARRQRPQK